MVGIIVISIENEVSYTEKRDLGIILNIINGFTADHDVLGNNRFFNRLQSEQVLTCSDYYMPEF